MRDTLYTARPATRDDAAVIVEFNLAMARETESLELSPATLAAGVRNLFDNPQFGFYVVAETRGDAGPVEPAGSLLITYEWSDWRDGIFWWVQSVYVRDGHRRRGVYTVLYEFVKRLAAADPRVRGFRLYVERENAAAQKTYERLGMSASHYVMYEEIV
ncbi:MAG TPA: GNAT family N-acetyltransferase [Pyrinomonadaceae bacterium]|nr:GNAT family N-acetyltransferase [Pyrinomonadaceae bacterium]